MALKVYGGNAGGTHRCIVAATSKAEAVRQLQAHGLNTTMHYFKDYWGVTGNVEELELALAAPGSVFAKSYREHGAQYRPVALRPSPQQQEMK